MDKPAHRYFMVNKPFHMASQFVSVEDVPLLSDIEFDFPGGMHVLGRLDALSEGLLLLTTNKRVIQLLFTSGKPHRRTYLVRVNGVMTHEKAQQLREGVTIRVRGAGEYKTAPCELRMLDTAPDVLPYQKEQNPHIAHTWLEVSLYEGKRHQLRSMMRAVNHPCRRLIRTSIADMYLGNLAPGAVKEIEEQEFFRLLNLEEQP